MVTGTIFVTMLTHSNQLRYPAQNGVITVTNYQFTDSHNHNTDIKTKEHYATHTSRLRSTG
jgi:hypothetical protein